MYGFLYLLVTFQAPDGWGAAFGSLAAIYGAGFLGVVAGYFWARWFVIGLGLSGFMTGVISMLQMGDIEYTMLFYAGTHIAVSGLLWGDGMAKAFDGKSEWRQRFHLDESATNRLGKSVIRVGVSLPYVVLFALAPREGSALALIGGGLVVTGAFAMSKMRSWAVVAMGAGTVTMLASVLQSPSLIPYKQNLAVNLDFLALGAIGFTMAALTPFAGPVWRALSKD